MQLTATLPAQLRRIGRAVVDGVLPPRCLACGAIVDEPDALCGPCWAAITFFTPPWCAVCGLPFPHPMGDKAVCADCARDRPSWDRARAVLRYDRRHGRGMRPGITSRRRRICRRVDPGARAAGGRMTCRGVLLRGEPCRSRTAPPTGPVLWI